MEFAWCVRWRRCCLITTDDSDELESSWKRGPWGLAARGQLAVLSAVEFSLNVAHELPVPYQLPEPPQNHVISLQQFAQSRHRRHVCSLNVYLLSIRVDSHRGHSIFIAESPGNIRRRGLKNRISGRPHSGSRPIVGAHCAWNARDPTREPLAAVGLGGWPPVTTYQAAGIGLKGGRGGGHHYDP
jgi:hypothetical protein